jgi:uncharacterized coiled-coil protein SlyX
MAEQKWTKEPWETCILPNDSEWGVHAPNHPDAKKSGAPAPHHMSHGITICRGMTGPNRKPNAERIAECVNALAGIEDPEAFVKSAAEQDKRIADIEAEINERQFKLERWAVELREQTERIAKLETMMEEVLEVGDRLYRDEVDSQCDWEKMRGWE